MTGIIALAGALLQLILIVVQQYFISKKKAEDAQAKYELDQSEFKSLVARSLDKMRTDAKNESEQAENVEDRMDSEK